MIVLSQFSCYSYVLWYILKAKNSSEKCVTFKRMKEKEDLLTY